MPEEADKSSGTLSTPPRKGKSRNVGSHRRTPLRTPAVHSMAGKTSGRTPIRAKAIKKPEYRAFKDDDAVAQAMSRIEKCFLCSIVFSQTGKGKITEHDHHTGAFRGVTCGSCNVRDGKAAKAARRLHDVTKADYEAGKPMPPGFFDSYAEDLSIRLEIDLAICREYITGDRWRRFSGFFSS